MEEYRQDDERDMDRRKIVCEPPWEVDVGDRAIVSPKGFGKPGEGTMKPVRCKNQTLATNYNCRYHYTPIRALRKSCIEQVDHTRLDREPGQSVNGLDGHKYYLLMPWLPLAPGAISLCPIWTPSEPPVRLLGVHPNSSQTPVDSGVGT